MKRTFTITLIFVLSLVTLLSSCDYATEFDGDIAATDSVIVVGTNVSADFLETGEFIITAIPLDDKGAAILSRDIDVVIDVSNPSGINETINIDQINDPSGKPLAIAVDIDGSGSMASTDPSRLRVSGAKKFIDILESSNSNYEVAAFAYRGTPAFPFTSSQLLQTFSNDPVALKTAFDLVRQDSDTPTYSSLYEILSFMDTTKVASQFNRSIVIFSDGAPGDFGLKDEVCFLADSLDIPINSIGLGPASDLVASPSLSAVSNMREIANCSGGAYAGISAAQDSVVTAVYTAIANATALGNLGISVTLSGTGFDSLQSGDLVEGIITFKSAGESASASFAFTAP